MAGTQQQAPVSPVVNIPGYKIVEVLGKGGMAIVYLAIQESIGRHVALKILAPNHTDETFTDRFLREARIISQLAHPNIITIFDAGVEQGYHYMCMEYVPGKNLTQARDVIGHKHKIGIIKQIALALDYASKKGYVHRDIKPENIMLHEDGRAILTDFGIAHSQDVSRDLTQTGKAIGTPYFMSPEQTKGMPVDHRSDIYSLGVVMFQAVAGYVPFDGASIVAIGIKHIAEPTPTLPPGMELFQPIINKCLSKDPQHRYQCAYELYQALDAISEAQLDYIDAKAKALQNTGPNHHSRTIPDQPSLEILIDSAARPVPVSNSLPNIRAQRVSTPIDITDTDEFKQLARQRRRWILVLLLLVLIVAGYYKQDVLLSFWHQDIQPLQTQSVPATSQPTPQPVVSPQATSPLTPQPAPTTSTAPANPVVETTQAPATVAIPLAPGQTPDKTSQTVAADVKLYRDTLRISPDDVSAREGIEQARIWFKDKIELALINKDVDGARQLLADFKHSFPRLATTQAIARIEQNIEQVEQFNDHLEKARVYMAANALAKPDGANALEEFLAASRYDANDPAVHQGLQEIARNFYDKAKTAQSENKLADAVQYVASGLQAVATDTELLKLKQEVETGITQQQQLTRMLQDADAMMRKNQVIDPASANAYRLYHAVLRQDPRNQAARNGLHQVELWLVSQTEALYSKQEYLPARELLKRAQEYFPESKTFIPLQVKIDTAIDATYPKITRIEFSAAPITSLTAHTSLDKLAPGNILYAGFAFKNFYDPSTVLVAQLKDTSGQLVYDEKSVKVAGSKGEGYFALQLPNPGSDDASYSVELYMKDVRILKANLAGLH